MRSDKRYRFGMGAIAAALVLAVTAGCSGTSPSEGSKTPAAGSEKATVRLADTQFQTLWINNAIA
ncbi:MAG TPA: hypothetical protein VD902_12740, partial [Symbiobacteriaceae bacterium]|nr:hypothetical protein [Symbiobacteriaceae bacterium]